VQEHVSPRIDSGCYVRPCDGEALSGDAALVSVAHEGVLAAVIDALGHGTEAHRVSERLMAALSAWLATTPSPDPQAALMILHESARGTRGAVATVAWLNLNTLEGSVAGIGNVRCRLFGTVTRSIDFGDGVLGQRMRSPRCFALALQPADVVLLFSDGVAGRFRRDDYPSLGLDPASAIAFNIVRRFSKGTDDASCAVVRCRW
jgi:negative regulator of sigma-B (phosphoserine phosphatase)